RGLWRRKARRLGELGLLRRLRRGARNFAEAGEGGRLVDPAVEDRGPPLDAFHDHIAALQAGLSSKLGGGKVDGHWGRPPFPPALWARSMPSGPDGLNISFGWILG